MQPHTLEVSFATLQLLYQLCAGVGQACPIPQQSDVIDPVCVWLQVEDTLNTRCNLYHL